MKPFTRPYAKHSPRNHNSVGAPKPETLNSVGARTIRLGLWGKTQYDNCNKEPLKRNACNHLGSYGTPFDMNRSHFSSKDQLFKTRKPTLCIPALNPKHSLHPKLNPKAYKLH